METKYKDNSSISTNKKSMTAKIFAFISPVKAKLNTNESLDVKINSNGFDLDVDSLLTNDEITKHAQAIRKAL